MLTDGIFYIQLWLMLSQAHLFHLGPPDPTLVFLMERQLEQERNLNGALNWVIYSTIIDHSYRHNKIIAFIQNKETEQQQH